MDQVIKRAVDQQPALRLQVNKGDRHRISHVDIKRGSLWITPRAEHYKVEPTGGVGDRLHEPLTRRYGNETGEDYAERWKYWDVPSTSEVERIIGWLGSS